MFVPLWLIILTVIFLIVALVTCILGLNKIISIIAGVAALLSLLGMFISPALGNSSSKQQTTNQTVQSQKVKVSSSANITNTEKKSKENKKEKSFPWILFPISAGAVAMIAWYFLHKRKSGGNSISGKKRVNSPPHKGGRGSDVIGK